MKQEVMNFGRFYALLKLMPGGQNPDELKEEVIWKFIAFRTNSLRKIRSVEYDQMIEHMKNVTGEQELERKRHGYYSDDAKLWRIWMYLLIFWMIWKRYRKILNRQTMDRRVSFKKPVSDMW